MTALWDDQTLARIDDDYDRDRASNDTSRFGEYLRLNSALFRDSWSDEPAPVEDPVEFAVHAWRTATGPVMSPGYVQTRPDLSAVTLHRDEYDGALYADIHLRLRHAYIGAGLKRFPYGKVQDWEPNRNWGDGDYTGLEEPRENKEPSVLTSVIIRVPGRKWPGLVTPTAFEGRTLLDEAQETLTAVVRNLNVDAAPIVARILE